MNVINYIFNKDFTGGEGAELEPGPSCGGGRGPSQSLWKGRVLGLKEEVCLHIFPPVLLDSSQAHSVL